MKIKLIGFLSLFFFINFLACMNKNNLPDGLYARIDTSKGEILLNLEFKKTPLTVANFVGLAEDTKDSNKKGSRFYDGLKFHRVIADFMVQGGDPLGNGTGGPGYQFEDEFDSSLKHDKPGILSMANSGPGSNGSQFFITHVATPWLDGKHTVFGAVVEGIEVVNKIAQDDMIKSVEIIRVGKEAEAFKATEDRFQELRKGIAEKQQKAATVDMKELITTLGLKDTVTSKTGLVSSISKAGTGSTPPKGSTVIVHYTGQLTDGNVFDSSHNRNEPFQFTLGAGQVIPGWDEAVAEMKKGEERTVILPPALAYGSRGIGPIPPNSTLVFKIELLDYK